MWAKLSVGYCIVVHTTTLQRLDFENKYSYKYIVKVFNTLNTRPQLHTSMYTITLVQNFGMKGDNGLAQAEVPSHGSLQLAFTSKQNRHSPLSVFVHLEINNSHKPFPKPRVIEKVLESKLNPKSVALFGLVGNYVDVKHTELEVNLGPHDTVQWKFNTTDGTPVDYCFQYTIHVKPTLEYFSKTTTEFYAAKKLWSAVESSLCNQQTVLKENLENALAKVDSLQSSTQQLQATLQSERDSFAQQQRLTSEKIDTQQSQLESYQCQLDNALGVAENRRCTVDTMSHEMKVTRDTIQSLKESNQALREKLRTVQADLSQTAQELETLRNDKDYNTIETRCNRLKAKTLSQSQELQTVQHSLQIATEQRKKACKEVKTLQSQLSNMREYSRISDRPCQWSNKVFVFGSIDRPEINGYYKLQPHASSLVFKNNFNYTIKEGASEWLLLHESLHHGCPIYMCPKRPAVSSTGRHRPPEFGWRVNPDILSHTSVINNIMIFNMDTPAFRSREVSYLKERNQVLEEQYMSDYHRMHRNQSSNASAVVYPQRQQHERLLQQNQALPTEQSRLGVRHRRVSRDSSNRQVNYSGW